jgi:hypothetical protein
MLMVFAEKVAHHRLGIIVVARILELRLLFSHGWCLSGCGETQSVEYAFEDFFVVVNIVFGFWKISNFIRVCLEVRLIDIVLLG